MPDLMSQRQKPMVFEPIMPKKDCKLHILGAEMAKSWEHKVEASGDYKYDEAGKTKVMKLQLKIDDPDAKTENADAKPSLQFDDMVILENHPYKDKESGDTKHMETNKLFQLQEALGFEPRFVSDESGEEVEPRLSKSGKKYCPDGASRAFRQEFIDAYFDAQGEPRFDAWIGRDVVASVGYKKQSADQEEQYGRANEVKSYKPKQD